MVYLKCILILGIVLVAAYCENATFRAHTINEDQLHTIEDNRNSTEDSASLDDYKYLNISNSNNIVTNDTKHFVLINKRRAVIIINSPSMLRSKGRGRGRGRGRGGGHAARRVESLLYEEYNADGTKLIEFMMYNMEDVRKFFEAYLHTEICYTRCEDLTTKDPNTISTKHSR